MVTTRSERPRFFEGQYIGASDLAATVDYARELAREGALGGQSWGICIGLDLVEVANASGGFDYFILPGLAFDGYGRPIIVLAPAPVPASLFADFPSGNQPVWLRYDETQNRGLRPGWKSCDAGDAYARVREGFAIEAGPMTAVKDRQSGVEIAGVVVEDARLALNSIDADAPLICDASVPHQTFPADSARWLVPVGVAVWTTGAPGSLGERSADAKKVSRTMRRYVGQVAESLYAADGVLRLRDRMTDRDDNKTPDEQCAASSVTVDDLVNTTDPKDSSKTLDRLVGRELVWVEGHMRVTGDARLWGTKLELRKTGGSDANVPLHLVRGATANASGGEDLEIAIGTIADGKSRMLAGIAQAGQPFAPKLQFRNDGRLAVGPVIPADVKSYTILATTEGDTSMAIASAVNKVAKLQFATGATLVETAHLGFDDNLKKLRLGASTDLAEFMYMTQAGKVGIKINTPEQLDADANDLVVKSPAHVGITLISDQGMRGRINFADDVADPDRRHAGSILYDHGNGHMEFWSASAAQVVIGADGRVGMGVMSPGASLHIRNANPNVAIETTSGTNPRLSLMSGGVTRTSLELEPGSLRARLVNAGVTSLTAQGNRVGINLGNAGPATNLHVQGSIDDDASDPANHVAFFENLSNGTSADVLALKVGTTSPKGGNNFITFFGGNNIVGRIEGNSSGNGVSFLTGSGDFAECLKRDESEMPIGPGRIVGVHGGKISLVTQGADGLMVTTDRAAVVGNVPSGGEKDWERVALIGQVALMVDGPVAAGDYIVPSGHDDGIGRAVSPDRLDARDAVGVVGRAWEASEEPGRKRITVAIGTAGTTAADAMVAAVAGQAKTIARLQAQLAALAARLEG